jgi:cytochrome b subunit of formate dehydrogenase
MLAHNIVIFIYEVTERRRKATIAVSIPRFTANEIIQHILLLTSFITLAITGFALKFPNSWWSASLLEIGMTERIRQNVHRVSAVVMVLAGFYHVIYIFVTRRGREILLAMLPKIDDLRNVFLNLAYYLRISKKRPEFDNYDYAEKAEYWALIWGTIVMGATGLILWFPTLVGNWAPVWFIKVSEIIHFYEAILATLAIIVWHWFFVIFRPSEYPMSFTWIDGKMSLEHYRHHHEKHFKKFVMEFLLNKAGKIEDRKISYSTKLFSSALKKYGLKPDEVIQAELDKDHQLRSWVKEQLEKT